MSKIKTNGSLTKLSSPSLLHKDISTTSFNFHPRSRSSNSSGGSEDDLLSIGVHSSGTDSNNGTMKRKPLSDGATTPVCSPLTATVRGCTTSTSFSSGLNNAAGLSNRSRISLKTVTIAPVISTSTPGLSSSHGLTPKSPCPMNYSSGIRSPSSVHTSPGGMSNNSGNVFWSHTNGLNDSSNIR